MDPCRPSTVASLGRAAKARISALGTRSDSAGMVMSASEDGSSAAFAETVQIASTIAAIAASVRCNTRPCTLLVSLERLLNGVFTGFHHGVIGIGQGRKIRGLVPFALGA